jgi:histidinol-phosphate aminotransferase
MSKRKEIGSLFRKHIPTLVPYSSARDEYSGTAHIYLDANENPHNAPLNRYPDPGQLELKKAVAAIKGQQVENLFLGNGSDEGIDLLIRVFCNPGVDNLVTVDPTYGMYGVAARIHNVEVRQVLLRPDFSLDPEAVLKAVDEHTKLVFICSPNNPTSNAFNRHAIESIVDGVNCMVVLDEAYIDFSSQEGWLTEVPQKRNLAVLQTLSKAWGLAGIRLGMVFGDPELIRVLSNVKYPYNINTLTIDKALESIREKENYTQWVAQILEERDRLADKLGSMPLVEKVFPSDSNFLLVKVAHPRQVYQNLMEQGIIVRDRSSVPLCAGCLRITVGTAEENRALLVALGAFHPSNERRKS